jgi:hypothetical protein
MPMIIYCTRLHLSENNGSLVVSTKQNTNFNFERLSPFLYFPQKMV